jgi:hypothetical protein
MRDIATLKERVGHAERHLKATETARNRESEALMETWRKIRERFTHQETEIARYRGEVEALTESNESLSRMVDDLIGIIDGNIERGRDETVPKIATLAGDLLASEPSPEDFAQFADDAPVADIDRDTGTGESDESYESDDILDLELELDQDEAELVYPEPPNSGGTRDDDEDADRDVTEASLSPGIRSLIQRVEGSVRESRDTWNGTADDDHGAGEGDDAVEDEDLARELKEIETLRNELSGLRDRITTADR